MLHSMPRAADDTAQRRPAVGAVAGQLADTRPSTGRRSRRQQDPGANDVLHIQQSCAAYTGSQCNAGVIRVHTLV